MGISDPKEAGFCAQGSQALTAGPAGQQEVGFWAQDAVAISDPKEAGFCAQGSPENQRDYGNPVSEIIEQHPKDPGFWTHVAPGSQQVLGAQASAGVQDLGLDFVNSGPGTQCFQGLVQAASRSSPPDQHHDL